MFFIVLATAGCLLLRATTADGAKNYGRTRNATRDSAKVVADDAMKMVIGKNYDNRIRPPNYGRDGKNGPVEVDVECYVRSMSNIDFVRMEYSIQMTFRQFWRDPRLAYKEKFSGRKVPKFLIITEKDLIWTPDTFFMNEKQAHRHAIDKLNIMIRIHSDGSVMYSERLSLTLACAMHLQKYPMDVQTCLLLLGSYAFTTDDIVYQWKKGKAIQFHPMLNTSLPNFSLEPPETTECISRTTTGEYSCIQVAFTMKRMFSYYLAQVYVPSTLLVVVSWVSFWLDRTAVPARISLGVTTLLTMTTQAAAINNRLPAVSYIKAVDVWTGVCLAFIFATVLEFAFVSYKTSMKKSGEAQKHIGRHTGHTEEMEKPHDKTRRDSWGAVRYEEEKLLNVADESSIFGLHWWQEWKIGADPAKMIDLRSRIIFPLLFIIFNIIYWSWYSAL